MVRKSNTTHWPWFFVALCIIFPALVAYGRGPEDLLDLRKLTKKLKLSPAQQDSARWKISQIRNTLKAFEWDYARMTSEAAIWKGMSGDLNEVRDRKKKAIAEIDRVLDNFRGSLDSRQQDRLDGMTKRKERLLDLRFNQKMPFCYIDTWAGLHEPNQTDVYYFSFTKPQKQDQSKSYSDLLKTRIVRTYAPLNDPLRSESHITDDLWQPTRGKHGPGLENRLVRSPLTVAATLMSPDLVEAEVHHICKYYNPKGRSLSTIREAYWSKNRIENAIFIRLKMRTPYAPSFLSLKNWTIYLEDDEGTAYEPIEAEEMGIVRPHEPMQVRHTGEIVWRKGWRLSPGTDSLEESTGAYTYSPREARVKLFFPIRNFLGTDVVTQKTKYLKLYIKYSGDGSPSDDIRPSGPTGPDVDVGAWIPLPHPPSPKHLEATWWFKKPKEG